MYPDDSFYTLSVFGQIGLVCLSTLLGLLAIAAGAWLSRSQKLPVRLLIALMMFWAFVWLSPQVYYLYYQSLFDGLPWQIVVQSVPDFTTVARLFAFQGEATLSDHSKGVLGWAMIVACSFARRRPAS